MIPSISVLVLNYGADEKTLDECVASVEASDCAQLLEVVIADNGSVEHGDAPEAVAARHDRTRVEALGSNWGFAGGINRGLARCRGEWVFLLNNDASLRPDALRLCAEALEAAPPDCVATVPKILLRHRPEVIDAVGNVVNPAGEAFNVGIGQLDVGQYDEPERCFGPCFAAGLFRRDAFAVDQVGPLDETFFMYYEDVDWNWRANLFGATFVTAPRAVVLHDHSGTAGKLPYGFKYLHIERNLLATVMKNMSTRQAVKVWRARFKSHLRHVVLSDHRRVSAQIVLQAILRLPDTWLKHRWVRRRRVVGDGEVFGFGRGEQPFFDAPSRSPALVLGNLAAAYRRKGLLTGEGRWLEVANLADHLTHSRVGAIPGVVRSRLLPLLEGEPEAVQAFVRGLDGSMSDEAADLGSTGIDPD